MKVTSPLTLIFDLDGTLLDTLEDLWASVNHALALYSLPLRSKCEVRSFLGNGARVLIHRSLAAPNGACSLSDNSHEENFVSPELEEKVFAAFRQYYFQHNQDLTRPYPGIMEMLRQCKERGYKTAIVSNKPDAAVQQLHQRFFADVIDVAFGERQPAIRRKPAPDMVLLAIETLQATKDQTLYVGDSEVDIATARNAGLPCVCVDWGFRDRHFLEEQGATRIIHLPNEIVTSLSPL